jgi:hypothetical protein
MLYLNKFDSEQEMITHQQTYGVVMPSINYIASEGKSRYFRDMGKDIVGSVALLDKISGNIIYVLTDYLISYNSTLYTPIGVVVIPSSHDVYGTGECGIMSVMEMDYNNPEKGSSSNTYVYWGDNTTDLSLPNLNQVPLISTALTSNEITGVTGYANLPSTKFTTNKPSVGSGLDTLAGYRLSSYIPSPYLEDGSRNPSYYTNDTSKYPGLLANCLSDFDGVGNTTVITAAATAQTDWKTASAITNKSKAGYYPAACCCYRFNPDGNSAGKWYLPAMGELGYLRCRFGKLALIIEELTGDWQNIPNNNLWSSTERSGKDASVLLVNGGYHGSITGWEKDGKDVYYGLYARPFAILP